MEKKLIEKTTALLSKPQKIVIVAHQNPDGDAIGSSLGLYLFLKSNPNHKVSIIMPNDFPDFLKWMPAVEDILIFEKNKTEVSLLIHDASLLFTLDFNTFSRTNDMESVLSSADADFIMIDHHQSPDNYALVTYSDTKMSSTSEMVYHFIRAIDKNFKFTKEIATNLYTGIMTDTGSFRYPSTTAVTHRVLADLIDSGAPNSFIHESVFDINTPERMKLLGVALNNLKILPEYKTAYITLSQDELDKHDFKKGDTEGFVNYALSVKNIIFAAMFIESKQEERIKISFRSKGNFHVNEFSANHFNGGGHLNAAGGRSTDSLEDTVFKFIQLLNRYKTQLNES